MDLISIITPTYGRHPYLMQALDIFLAQDYPNLEWLILDDSPNPAQELLNHPDPRIRYFHSDERLTIGSKRNQLIEKANGNIIAHFDDDDYYAPNYISTMARVLDESNYDLLNLKAWYLYHEKNEFFGYWDLLETKGMHFVCYPAHVQLIYFDENNLPLYGSMALGYGFGWIYKKAVWEANHYDDINWNEDGEFALKALEKFKLGGIKDTEGLCLHVLHGGNTSTSFPQFKLPHHLIKKIFPAFQLL
jgi:glycosyltransferase involved in cell wall biosynthesis